MTPNFSSQCDHVKQIYGNKAKKNIFFAAKNSKRFYSVKQTSYVAMYWLIAHHSQTEWETEVFFEMRSNGNLFIAYTF